MTIPALPDNLTTWIIEAIINTRKSEVGIGITHIQTSKNVLINDNLPRFLGTSDRVEIAPVIFNKTNKDSIFDITLDANNVDPGAKDEYQGRSESISSQRFRAHTQSRRPPCPIPMTE